LFVVFHSHSCIAIFIAIVQLEQQDVFLDLDVGTVRFRHETTYADADAIKGCRDLLMVLQTEQVLGVYMTFH